MVQISHLIVAVTLIAFALFIWRANPGAKTNICFALQTLLFGLWGIGIAGLQTGSYLDAWGAFTFAVASFIPVAVLAATESLAVDVLPLPPVARRIILCGAVGFAVCAAGTEFVVSETKIVGGELTRRTGPLLFIFAMYFVAVWILVLTILFIKWRWARGLEKAQLQYVGAGLITGAAGGIGVNLVLPLVTGRSTYSWVGPYFSLMFMGFTTHAIIRHRLMDLRLVVHRGLTLAIATILSLVPVAIAFAFFWPRLAAHFGSAELLLVLVIAIFVTLVSAPTRDIARRLLDRYVYRTQANYQRTVREASRALTRVLDLKRLLDFISRTVVGSTGVEAVVIYLNDEDGFRRAIVQRRDDANKFDAPDLAPAEVVGALARAQDAVVADELSRQIVTESDGRLGAILSAANWALLLPVLSDDRLIAFIAVGAKLSGDPFYSSDLDLLMTLANQAGIAINNARLYAQVVLANEYIENIVATMESGVVAITSAGRVAMFNRAAERLTGLAANAIKGRDTEPLPPCLSEPLLASAADGMARTLPEIKLPGAEVTRPVMCTTSPLRDPDGTVLGAVAVFSDLTPLKELEVERRRAERLAYFEVLASGIAHEIKNPLVAIKTFTQLLPRRSGEPSFLSEFGRIVGREILRMERVVDRLRTMAYPGRRPEHAIDVRVPLAEALEFMHPTFDEKRIVVSVNLGDTVCRVVGDHQNLVQLFLNLLMNAHEATPPAGAVTVGVTREAEIVRVTIEDTGPGIAPDMLEKVFEPFFTTKQRGSGLGLAISASVAQAHGAQLRADNRLERGAVFSIDFPLAPVTARLAV